jgi:hypothetical protein
MRCMVRTRGCITEVQIQAHLYRDPPLSDKHFIFVSKPSERHWNSLFCPDLFVIAKEALLNRVQNFTCIGISSLRGRIM